jgi:hypothetical protein
MGARNNVMALAVKLGWQWTLPIDFLDLFMGPGFLHRSIPK